MYNKVLKNKDYEPGVATYDPKTENEVVVILRRTDNARVAGSITISEFQDNVGRIHYPKFKETSSLYKEYGDKKFPVKIGASEEEKRFVMSNPIHAMQIEFVRDAHRYKVYPFGDAAPLLEIVDVENENEADLNEFLLRDQAMEIFKTELTTPQARRDFAIMFNSHTGSDKTVEINLRTLIHDAPNKFLSAWNQPEKELAILAHKAIERGIIVRNNDGMYRYGGQVIGMKIDAVISYLSKEVQVVPLIRNEIESK